MTNQLWQPAERAPAVAGLYAQAEKERTKHPDRFRLDSDELVATARAQAGYSDFWSDGILARLECLVDSINNEARMNAFGFRRAGNEMLSDMLRSALELERTREENPHLFKRQIDQPIFIIGGFRTGTTLLQRLLAADPNNRSPLFGEMIAATSIGKGSTKDIDAARNRAESSQQFLKLINPTMQSVRFPDVEEPKECILLMGTDLRNWALQSCMNLPGYCRMLSKEDFSESYARHKEILQMITEDETPRRWVLKATYHLPEITALLKAYPDALIINTHRDPVDTVTSTSSLYAAFRSIFSDDVNPREIGAQQVETLSDWFRRSIDARANLPDGSKARFFDYLYDELVADPLAMVRRIYDAFGLEFSDMNMAAMQAHLETCKKWKHGRHHYSPQQFGLNAGEVRERFSFYTARFGLS